MIRSKLVTLFLPVLAATFFLWLRRRKKASIAVEDSNPAVSEEEEKQATPPTPVVDPNSETKDDDDNDKDNNQNHGRDLNRKNDVDDANDVDPLGDDDDDNDDEAKVEAASAVGLHSSSNGSSSSSPWEKPAISEADDDDSGNHSSGTPPLDADVASQNGSHRGGSLDGSLDPPEGDLLANGETAGKTPRGRRRQRDNASTSVTSVASNGAANGNFNGAANGNFNGAASGNFNGAASGTFNGAANGTFNGAASGTFNGEAGPAAPAAPADPNRPVVYEFEFPSEFCGRLIGKGGRNLHQMSTETRTKMAVRKQTLRPDRQIVTVQGRHADVQRLLHNIRQKFPKHRHPGVDLRPINLPAPAQLTSPELLPLCLPDGVAVDVVVSIVVSAGHVFLQLPAHPTYPNLPRLDACMLSCYGHAGAPQLPTPVEPGVICAAPQSGGWYRAQVVRVEPSTSPSPIPGAGGDAYVRFVDYGGYGRVPVAELRQIRSDFITLPFQAIECYLANLAAADGSYDFPVAGAIRLEEMTQNSLLQAEVVAYAEDGVPCVNLFKPETEDTRTLINEALVACGFAVWIEAGQGVAVDQGATAQNLEPFVAQPWSC